MTSAVIADDEPLLREALKRALADLWPELEVAAECGDGAEALLAVNEHRPEICFLDIRMPKLTGIEVAERVQGPLQIVFVTAYDDHAVTAFEQGAVDYLLKPLKRGRLAATIQRLQERISKPDGQPQQRSWLKRIQATVGNTLRFFPVDDICCCHSDDKYTRVMTLESDALIRQTLTTLEANLDPDRFWRIHRSILVNVDYIDRVERDNDGQMKVVLRGGRAELPVSKPHQSQFRGM